MVMGYALWWLCCIHTNCRWWIYCSLFGQISVSLIPRPTSSHHFILAGKVGLVHIQRNLGSTAKFIAQFHVITILNMYTHIAENCCFCFKETKEKRRSMPNVFQTEADSNMVNRPNLGQALIRVASNKTVNCGTQKDYTVLLYRSNYTPRHALYLIDKSATVFRFVRSDSN